MLTIRSVTVRFAITYPPKKWDFVMRRQSGCEGGFAVEKRFVGTDYPEVVTPAGTSFDPWGF